MIKPRIIKSENNYINNSIDNSILELTPKSQATKAKTNKWNYIRRNFCTAKEGINKAKRLPMELDKYVEITYPIGGSN